MVCTCGKTAVLHLDKDKDMKEYDHVRKESMSYAKDNMGSRERTLELRL